MNWIFLQIYFLALQSPGKKTADDTAVMFIAGFLAMHLVLLSFVVKSLTGIGVPRLWEKPAIVGVCLACIVFSVYYYVFRKTGIRLIQMAGKSGFKPKPLLGIVIFLETVFMPVWFGLWLIFSH